MGAADRLSSRFLVQPGGVAPYAPADRARHARLFIPFALIVALALLFAGTAAAETRAGESSSPTASVSYKVKLTAKAKKTSTLSLVGTAGTVTSKSSVVLKLAGG